MIEHIQSYFQAEKSESLLFVGMGVVAMAAGIYMLLRGNQFQKGAAYPLIAIALIQLVVGGTVYLRTDAQVSGLIRTYESSPAEFQAKELPRMQAVNKSFDLYKIIEICLLIAGFGLMLFFRGKSHAWTGAGLGLSLQSAVLLPLDFFAESRADLYTSRILQL